MQMLKANGGIVDHIDTGEEALELVRHYDYDLVLLDLMLLIWTAMRLSAGCGPAGLRLQ